MGPLDDGRDENERLEEYSSALHAAAANGHRLVVRYLLKKQADIDLLTVSLLPLSSSPGGMVFVSHGLIWTVHPSIFFSSSSMFSFLFSSFLAWIVPEQSGESTESLHTIDLRDDVRSFTDREDTPRAEG